MVYKLSSQLKYAKIITIMYDRAHESEYYVQHKKKKVVQFMSGSAAVE